MDAPRTEWMVKHELQAVEMKLLLPSGDLPSLEARGTSANKRGSLWLHHSGWLKKPTAVEVADAVATLVQICVVDRPRRQEDIERLLRGSGIWEDVELPL